MDSDSVLSEINNLVKNTMIDHLGIVFTDVGQDYIEATMPVNSKTINPAKILHGGALMALAETVGSALSLTIINYNTHDIRGIEINGNHVKSTSNGIVKARASLIHKGKQTHVSEIKITDQDGNLLNISRMTNMVIEKQ